MNVSLTPELEAFVKDLADSGRYRSASEVVRAAVRLLQEHEAERTARLRALQRRIEIGVEELERGEGKPADEVVEEILRTLCSEAA